MRVWTIYGNSYFYWFPIVQWAALIIDIVFIIKKTWFLTIVLSNFTMLVCHLPPVVTININSDTLLKQTLLVRTYREIQTSKQSRSEETYCSLFDLNDCLDEVKAKDEVKLQICFFFNWKYTDNLYEAGITKILNFNYSISNWNRRSIKETSAWHLTN